LKTIEELVNKIHLGKWEDVMSQIPNSCVDIIITSPVYNVSLGSNKFKKDKYDTCEDNMPYDDYLNWMDKLFAECYRVLKPGGKLLIVDKDDRINFNHLHFGEKWLNFRKLQREYEAEIADIKQFSVPFCTAKINKER
jgi:DNA modification methylase